MKLLTFEIDGDLMGFEARHVSQVLEDIHVTAVCFTPPGYMGLIYYRGELFDTVDLAELLDRADSPTFSAYRFIIVRWSHHKMAVAVRKIVGIIWTENEAIDDVGQTEDGEPIKILSLDRIWEKLQGLPYGPV
jgi:chemotaxis signal transduction protein